MVPSVRQEAITKLPKKATPSNQSVIIPDPVSKPPKVLTPADIPKVSLPERNLVIPVVGPQNADTVINTLQAGGSVKP